MSVYKRGDKWTARFRWRADGKQQSISKTFATKEDAENWELERKIDRLQGIDKKLTKFLWLFDRYFDTYKKDYLRDSTKRQWSIRT